MEWERDKMKLKDGVRERNERVGRNDRGFLENHKS